MKKLFFSLIILGTVLMALFVDSHLSNAQEIKINDEKIKPEAFRQIQALVEEKQSRTPAERKIDSNLLIKIKMERSERIAEGISALETGLTVDERGFIEVDITAFITKNLLDELRRINAEILVSFPSYRSITASVPVAAIESLAAMDEVIFIMPKQEAVLSEKTKVPLINIRANSAFNSIGISKLAQSSSFEERAQRVRNFIASNLDSRPETGSVNSQGDTTHGAGTFRSTTGFNGTGIKIGVLSNGINNVVASQASGNLPTITYITGQAGNGDEGTAMLEIIYDIAPGAQLYFATGNNGITSFAQNIRGLRALGCNIIIDDIGYYGETAFQNGQASNVISTANGGVVVQAVNDVTVGSQAGALYFSSAGNSGNKNDGTSGVWEGDFVDGGTVGGIPGNLHNFGGTLVDTITVTADANNPSRNNPVILQWSDPLGGSANDYDLYILNNAGTQILGMSDDVQTGTQDPIEGVPANLNIAGNLIVVAKYSGAGRFLHINTNGGRLNISTSGVVYGHNAGFNTISIAATPASNFAQPPNPVGPFPNLFNTGNKVELFSSDGPRRIFYNADSSAITPGNASSTGGLLLQKPDITAADGVSVTGAGGFSNPFFGTSAAAPHAAALAALLKSACPVSTNAQLVSAMKATAIDIEAAGTDRDSGAGIFMPIPARAALCGVAPTSRKRFDFDGDSRADVSIFRPSNGQWWIYRSGSNSSYAATFGISTDKIVPADYTGDGKTDIAFWRPSTREWFILRSENGTYYSFPFGVPTTDVPAPGDFDGDGKADAAIFRPSSGTWYIQRSSDGGTTIQQFGQSGDIPVVANYDGDTRDDIAVYRPTTGVWWLSRSSLGTIAFQFGNSTDKVVPGDYTGDAKADVAIFRSGTWFVLRSENQSYYSFGFGLSGDLAAPGDFDGDGKFDPAVFRPSNATWYELRSQTGTSFIQQFGLNGDRPTPNAFVP